MQSPLVSNVALGVATALHVSSWYDRHYKKEIKSDKILRYDGFFNADKLEKLAPQTVPRPFYPLAWQMVGRIEGANGVGMETLLRRGSKAAGHHFGPPTQYAIDFGKWIAYNCIGRRTDWCETTHGELFGMVLPPFEEGFNL